MTVEWPNPYAQVIIPFRHSLAAKDWTITFGVERNQANTAQEMVNAAFDSFKQGFGAARIDSNVTVGPAVAYYKNGAGDLELWTSDATVPAYSGTLSSTAAPPNVAVSLRRKTAFVGKKWRGRMYFPPVLFSEGNIDENGTIVAASLNTINGYALTFLDSLEAQSELEGGMWLFHSDPLVAPTAVEQLLFSNVVRTQRRRLPR